LDDDDDTLPGGRFTRLARLAGLSARTSASLLLSRDGTAAARVAADVLSNLRGLAAKVGQMASYVDGFVPEPHRQVYEEALTRLRSHAATSPPEAIRRLVESELGAPLDRLFVEWEDAPFASASIGQVHRARLPDGRAVAVKVQHPGIEVAIESDLKNAGVVENLLEMVGPRALDPSAIFDDLKARFREELDYGLEAERQMHFRRLHAESPRVRIPYVVAERSRRRVITSELMQGASLEEAARAPEALRREYAETLWRFVFSGTLLFGLFNADPHPGNYLFQEDGSVVFLDFGCVQPIEQDKQERGRAMHWAALRRDEAAFAARTRRMLETRGGAYEQAVVPYVRRCFEPLFGSPFHIEPAYVTEVVTAVRDLKKHVFARDGSFVPLGRGMVFMNRLQFGFYSVLARLDVTADYARVERGFLEAAGVVE
jgi:predicted unusual protein kinase regulating ubiquinone biosynthesis (AarF/ABC1/UbiB family)